MDQSLKLLNQLNSDYFKLHKNYEELYWISYMGDHSVNKKLNQSLREKEAFINNKDYCGQIKKLIKTASTRNKERLQIWLDFFEQHQESPEAAAIKDKAHRLELHILSGQAQQKEGYEDPYTKKFVSASLVKMRTMIRTNPDEKIRKACFVAQEKLAENFIKEYIEMINLRNRYTRALGFSDFYDFKVQREDGMTKKELFSLFDSIYEKTKYALKDSREL
jgi:hypothetical protein